MRLGPVSSEGISMAPGDTLDRLPDSERALARRSLPALRPSAGGGVVIQAGAGI